MNLRKYPNDIILLGIILLLSGFGIVMMYSASSIIAMNWYDNYLHFLLKQIQWLIIGGGLMVTLSFFNYRHLKKFGVWLLVLSWVFMVLGYIFKGNNPAARWLVIGGRSWMTTSDFARVSLIIFTASFIGKNKKNLSNWKFLVPNYTPFFAVTLLLILFQPDTSTTIVVSFIALLLLFIAGADWRYLGSIVGAGCTALVFKVITTPYQFARITNWKAGINDGQNMQSIYALGHGGITGNGLGDSIVKNGFLPEVHTDFILPIVGEELGFIGVLLLFAVFWFFFTRGLKVVQEAPDLFSMFLALGIISSVMIYFLVNAAYVVGFAPTTGLPMPFISYGGSHTIFTLMSMGILLNIARRARPWPNSIYRGYAYDL